MGWITPITNWTPSPVGNADFNRIEGNIKYLREETATFNGAKTFTDNITQTAGVTSLKVTNIKQDTYSLLSLDRTDNPGVSTIFDMSISTTDALDIRNKTGALTLLRLDSSGRVIIGNGTDNGVDKLQVNGSIYASGGIKIGSGGTLITKIEWVA